MVKCSPKISMMYLKDSKMSDSFQGFDYFFNNMFLGLVCLFLSLGP